MKATLTLISLLAAGLALPHEKVDTPEGQLDKAGVALVNGAN